MRARWRNRSIAAARRGFGHIGNIGASSGLARSWPKRGDEVVGVGRSLVWVAMRAWRSVRLPSGIAVFIDSTAGGCTISAPPLSKAALGRRALCRASNTGSPAGICQRCRDSDTVRHCVARLTAIRVAVVRNSSHLRLRSCIAIVCAGSRGLDRGRLASEPLSRISPARHLAHSDARLGFAEPALRESPNENFVSVALHRSRQHPRCFASHRLRLLQGRRWRGVLHRCSSRSGRCRDAEGSRAGREGRSHC